MLRSHSIVTYLLMMFAVSPLCTAETTIVKAKQYIDVANGSYVSPAVIVIEDGIIKAIAGGFADVSLMKAIDNPSNVPGNCHETGKLW